VASALARDDRGVWVAAGLVALLALAVYVRTLAPSITWAHDGADSGDFAAAAACHGVPHPTGYPTYLLAAELAVHLPWGDVAHRLNLLSAAAGAASAGLMVMLAGLVLHESRRPQTGQARGGLWQAVPAASAGLLLAFGPLTWSQAVVAEVYTLHLAFVVGLLLIAALSTDSGNGLNGWDRESHTCSGRWQVCEPAPTQAYPKLRGRAGQGSICRRAPFGSRRGGWATGLVFALLGLGLGNHLSLALMLPALIILLWDRLRAKPFRFLASAAVGLMLGLGVYAVIPLRAIQSPPINWGGASSPEGFWWLVSGRAYRGLVLGLPLGYLPARAAVGLRILAIGLGVWGVPFAIFGAIGLWERNRRLAASTLTVFALYSLYAMLYDTTDSYVYLLPAAAAAALWMACGLHAAIEWAAQHGASGLGASRVHCGVYAAALALSLIGLPWHWSAMDLSREREALDYALNVMQTVDRDAIVIVRGDAHTFSLWYARYGLNLRDDVAIVNEALLHFDWYRAIVNGHHPEVMDSGRVGDVGALLAANIGKRAVYFGDLPQAEEWPAGRVLEPAGPLWRVEEGRSGSP